MAAPEFEGLHVVVTGASGALGGSVLREVLARGATCHVPLVEPGFDFGDLAGGRLVATGAVDLRDEPLPTG